MSEDLNPDQDWNSVSKLFAKATSRQQKLPLARKQLRKIWKHINIFSSTSLCYFSYAFVVVCFFQEHYQSVKQFGLRLGPTKNVGPNLGQNCLQRLSADNKFSSMRINVEVFFQAMAEHKNKFERDMLLNRQNMSEGEYKRLLKEHEREMEALNQNLEAEKDRQRRVIADKVRNMSHRMKLEWLGGGSKY